MSRSTFEDLEAAHASAAAGAVLDCLADALRHAGSYDELFEARLMQSRHRLGLPVAGGQRLDDLEDPVRGKLEAAYLEACREVGTQWLDIGEFRRGWAYLQAVGDRKTLAVALAKIEPNESNVEELIEVALHGGAAPTIGMRLVLDHYGTCNAITTFESTMQGWQSSEQREVAAMLVRHLHGELLSNLRADIARREGNEPPGASVGELIENRDWLFADHNYHIDASHLSATVNFARLLADQPDVALALELAEYGRRLSSQYHYPGEEPFADVYEAHAKFFRVLLDDDVEQNLEFFRTKAQQLAPETHGYGPAEVYVALLARLGRFDEALLAAIECIPRGAPTSGFAPGLVELSQKAGRFDRLIEISREREDLIGFATGLVQGDL